MMFPLFAPWLAWVPTIVGCAWTPPPAPVALLDAGSSTISRFVGDADPATFEFFVTIPAGRTTELDVAARLAEGGE